MYLKEQTIKRRIEEEKIKLGELNYALELKNQFNRKMEDQDKKRNFRCVKAKNEFKKQIDVFAENKRSLDQVNISSALTLFTLLNIRTKKLKKSKQIRNLFKVSLQLLRDCKKKEMK